MPLRGRSLTIVALIVATSHCSASSSSPPPAESTTHLTLENAARVVQQASCAAMARCSGAAFVGRYPGGTAECVESGLNGIPNKTKTDGCTEEQVNQCAEDWDELDCPDGGGGAIIAPASCIALVMCSY